MSDLPYDLDGLQGVFHEHEPLARYTSWRIGGPAQRLYRPADLDDLGEFLARVPADEPLFWLGLGSNLLIRDGGIRGTVVVTQGVLDGLELMPGQVVRAGADSCRVS